MESVEPIVQVGERSGSTTTSVAAPINVTGSNVSGVEAEAPTTSTSASENATEPVSGEESMAASENSLKAQVEHRREKIKDKVKNRNCEKSGGTFDKGICTKTLNDGKQKILVWDDVDKKWKGGRRKPRKSRRRKSRKKPRKSRRRKSRKPRKSRKRKSRKRNRTKRRRRRR